MKVFRLPDLGEGLAEAEIREWYVKVGEVVNVDQPLVSMETAKAVVDVPAPYAGKITELHGKVNDIIQTGAPLISFEATSANSEKSNDSKGSVVGALEESSKSWDEGEMIIGGTKEKTASLKAMPAARMLAKEMNVDLSTVTPTGPNGLITPQDIKKAAGQKTPSISAFKDGEPLHGARRAMAQAMVISHQEIVPVSIIEDADISDLPADVDLTVKMLQAMVAGARAEPVLNAWFDGKTSSRKLFTEVNIGLAVDSPEGLFVPVLNHVEKLSAEELRATINQYKEGVRNRSIAPAQMQGATITLSNFGSIVGRYATPIIIPPAVAILGCGRSREIATVKQGKVVVGRLLPLSLTFDHRAVTGGEATRYLGAVIKALTNTTG